jgi:hypothetical protein
LLILGLDLAVNTGFALGRPGATPRSGTVRLKKPSEDINMAARNLACFLRDMFVLEVPDLIVYEAPLPFFAGHSDQRQRSMESLVNPPQMCGAVLAIAGVYGIPSAFYSANKIRTGFLGKAHAKGRDETKRAVIRQCHAEGLMPLDCKDDNRADAIATWMYGCRVHAGYRESELVMFESA